jgi:hypothetical protein
MVPLSKSGRQKCLVGSNPTLSAERCWSGLTGTPGERVSPLATVGSNPTLSAIPNAKVKHFKIDERGEAVYRWGE